MLFPAHTWTRLLSNPFMSLAMSGWPLWQKEHLIMENPIWLKFAIFSPKYYDLREINLRNSNGDKAGITWFFLFCFGVNYIKIHQIKIFHCYSQVLGKCKYMLTAHSNMKSKIVKNFCTSVSKEDVDGAFINEFVLHPAPNIDSISFPLASKCLISVNGKLVDTLRKIALAETRYMYIVFSKQ